MAGQSKSVKPKLTAAERFRGEVEQMFYAGFTVQQIVDHLIKVHECGIGKRTWQTKLKEWGLVTYDKSSSRSIKDRKPRKRAANRASPTDEEFDRICPLRRLSGQFSSPSSPNTTSQAALTYPPSEGSFSPSNYSSVPSTPVTYPSTYPDYHTSFASCQFPQRCPGSCDMYIDPKALLKYDDPLLSQSEETLKAGYSMESFFDTHYQDITEANAHPY